MVKKLSQIPLEQFVDKVNKKAQTRGSRRRFNWLRRKRK